MRWAGLLIFAGCASPQPRPALFDQAAQGMKESKARRYSGELVMRCDPADAEVWVDGVPRGACSDFAGGRGLSLGEGLSRIEVKKQGFRSYQTFIDAGGTRATLTVALTSN